MRLVGIASSPAAWLAGLCFCLVASGLAWAQSNSCSTATVIGEGTFMGTTVGSTNDGSASCGSSSTSPDVWFSFTAQQNCTLAVDTCGSGYDTVLSIHTGCPGTSSNQLACNDDSCGLQSRVSISATGGATYLIRVAGFNGQTGAFTLNVSCAAPEPTSDACATAIPVVPGTYSGSTVGATNDGSASCGSSSTSPDVWYVFTATESCRLRASTCSGTSFDSVLSIHSACPGTTGNQLACNDDSCGLQSSVSANVMPGDYYIRVAGFNGATGSFALTVSCDPVPPGSGPDLIVGDLNSLQQQGRVGDVVGCAMASILCNQGNEDLDWFANPDPRHPFITWNLYRIEGGRFEQVGQAWAKHAFAAAQANACGLGCTPGSGLGVGCSDTYGAGLNGSQSILGPRHEINPWTGGFVYAGSHLQNHSGSHSPIDHRMQLRDSDFDPAQHPGAAFIAELWAVAHDDVEHTNSMSWEPVTITGSPGGTWSFNLSVSPVRGGPAIDAWTGATKTTIPSMTVNDGRSILAVQTTDNGDGTWHYEYAVYNMDMDRQVAAFSLPVSPGTTVSSPGFHAVASHGEGYSNDPWQFTRETDRITWATVPFDVNPRSNPIRWGTTYSFRFDADAAPAASLATLGLYKPGTPAELSGATRGPEVVDLLAGTVNSANGPPEGVLRVNGSAGMPITRVVEVALGSAITVSVDASSVGPGVARHGLWIWNGPPKNATDLIALGQTLGRMANPTPLHAGQSPQPVRCLSGGLPPAACGSVPGIPGSPTRAPWSMQRPQGLAQPRTLTIQGVLEDTGASNSTGFSVTNAVVIVSG
jgi:hypothetical protein